MKNINVWLVVSIVALVGFSIYQASKPKGVESTKPVSKQETQESNTQPKEVTTSIDDDAILGNRSTATVAIIEFSDYECPYCKRFVDQTFDLIKENFIDTGKAILVFRDLPLSFHNPAAERESEAAECARKQGGDSKYYEYHDKIFDTTEGNGKGISVENLSKLAVEIGLNGQQLAECVNNKEFKNEINKDIAEATKLEINGTPGFVVGILDENGNVTGTVISGAQPYSVFQQVIEAYLGN